MANKKKLLLYLLTFLFLLVAALFFLFQNELLGNKKISYSVLKNEELENKEGKNTPDTTAVSESNNPSPESQEAAADNSENKKEENTGNNSSGNDSSSSLKIINKLVSWGYEKSGARKIDTIIIHSSYNALGGDPYSLEKLLVEYKQYGVAPHYLIDRGGKIYRLVAEKNVAFHAGISEIPDGRNNINNFSIGIELMNKEDGKFTGEQYDSLNKLLKNLKSRYEIKYVLGHNQISEGRKTDPWNFNWNEVR
jgi:hypothetical protein